MSIQDLLTEGNIQLVINLNDLREIVHEFINIELEQSQLDSKGKMEMLSIDEVVALLHVNKSTLWRWDKCNYLTKHHRGRKVFYKNQDVYNLINNSK